MHTVVCAHNNQGRHSEHHLNTQLMDSGYLVRLACLSDIKLIDTNPFCPIQVPVYPHAEKLNGPD